MCEYSLFHGAKIFPKNFSSLLEFINNRIDSTHIQFTSFIATPNPEMYVDSLFDPQFRTILKNNSFNIIDGFGLHLGLKLFGVKHSRITGTDLVADIFADPKFSVYILGGLKGNIKKIRKKYPSLNIVGHYDGIVSNESESLLASEINNLKPDILLVALGAPKQEKWIAKNLPYLQDVKIAIGIGGAIDYLSGNVKRAPAFVRTMGLEWFYRLIKQPERYKRIVKAVIVFPVLFLIVETSLFLFRHLKHYYSKCKKTCRF